jgi:hypothetical protein
MSGRGDRTWQRQYQQACGPNTPICPNEQAAGPPHLLVSYPLQNLALLPAGTL